MDNKYNAKRISYEGFNFASQLEASVYTLLKARENAGEITDITQQIKIELIPGSPVKWQRIFIVDFRFLRNGEPIFAEAKGMEQADWKYKKSLWANFGPAPLEIYKGSHKHPYLDEIIVPKV